MSLTININGLTLCHKGSHGISTATVPDVCKTPTPGGPVPMPYPNVSMSSDLADGTESVTADGGNKIAIKGSSFSRSTGDEPGTIGGLKSNVNMKASKWILYSFNVKFESANACRLTDKKTQNNENTVDAGGNIQANQGGSNPIVIDCENGPASGSGSFTECEKEEICAKCADTNRLAKGKKLRRRSAAIQKVQRRLGDNKCDVLKNAAAARKPNAIGFAAASQKCKDEAIAADFKGYSPDHIHEIQLGGHPTAGANLRWMSSRPNEWMGRKLQDFKTSGKKKNTGVKPNCCP